MWQGVIAARRSWAPNPHQGEGISLVAKAFSCIATTYLQKARENPRVLQIDDLTRAAAYADASAALGLVSAVVLRIAQDVNLIAERLRVDLRNSSRFWGCRHLWHSFDIRITEMALEDQHRKAKVEKQPSAYVCAAEGCGLEGGKKSVLKRCAGKCSLALKPHYCSKECQIKDWKHHKPICKPGTDTPDSIAVTNPYSSTLNETGMTVSLNDRRSTLEDSLQCEDSGKERILTIPDPMHSGQDMKISSNTLSPGFMREFRDSLIQLQEERANR